MRTSKILNLMSTNIRKIMTGSGAGRSVTAITAIGGWLEASKEKDLPEIIPTIS